MCPWCAGSMIRAQACRSELSGCSQPGRGIAADLQPLVLPRSPLVPQAAALCWTLHTRAAVEYVHMRRACRGEPHEPPTDREHRLRWCAGPATAAAAVALVWRLAGLLVSLFGLPQQCWDGRQPRQSCSLQCRQARQCSNLARRRLLAGRWIRNKLGMHVGLRWGSSRGA